MAVIPFRVAADVDAVEAQALAVKISDERVVDALPFLSAPACPSEEKDSIPLAIRERMIDEKVAGFHVAAKRLKFARHPVK